AEDRKPSALAAAEVDDATGTKVRDDERYDCPRRFDDPFGELIVEARSIGLALIWTHHTVPRGAPTVPRRRRRSREVDPLLAEEEEVLRSQARAPPSPRQSWSLATFHWSTSDGGLLHF